MDVMRPKLQTIGNMCFRRLDIANDGLIDDLSPLVFDSKKARAKFVEDDQKIEPKQSKISEAKSIPSIDALEAEDDSEGFEERGKQHIEIKDISGRGNRFEAQMQIGKYFHRFIIGQGGRQKREVEDMSRTRILVPSENDLTTPIVITGQHKDDVKYAITRLNAIIERTRNRSDFTHFVSIPLNHESIRERFVQFKNQVLQMMTNNFKPIDENLFQNSRVLHLTVIPLLLTDQNERTIASQVLKECHNDYIKPMTNGRPIRVKVEGIDCMNDDPKQVSVLYAKVHDVSDQPLLKPIVSYIFDRFKQSGLSSGTSHQFERLNTDSKVKIHMTVMNTKLLLKEESPSVRGRDRRTADRQCFDASLVIDKFGDYYFGETTVETIEISVRHSSQGKDGYYSHTYRIEL